uniref:Chromosome 19 open reading frame 47 n=1 Tax=Neogobius melanostomus TaxID=47308 RepID=A0A8C6SFH0_9GOBI
MRAEVTCEFLHCEINKVLTDLLEHFLATSEWIQFFKDAGIPASLAVNYAVSFVDNRIQKNMLMDLSKDIMMDLGITVIGDIIAILKHAKQVYRQDMCKMATEAISSGQTSVKAELRRTANTPATRMIANALSHESPPATPVRRSDNRLSVTVSNVPGTKKTKQVLVSQQADEGNSEPAVKRRRVTAEMEGKYIINMPKGTTARTRLILAQQAEKGLKRTSVFARLGAESKVDTSTTNNKPTGVFSRLDLTREEDPTKAPNVLINGDDSDGEESVLQYAGVLKKASPVPKKEPVVSKPTSLRRLGGKFKLPSSDTPTSSTVNGLPPAKISVLQRLGTHPGAAAPPTDEQDNRVTSTKPKAQERLIIASSKVSSSTGAGAVGDGHSAQMDARAVSVFKRLGNKKPNRLFYMCF